MRRLRAGLPNLLGGDDLPCQARSSGALLQALRLPIDLKRLPVAVEAQQDKALAKVGGRERRIVPDRLVVG